MRFVITFPVGGPLADRYSEIEAVDELTARLAIVGVYGTRGWAGVYPADGHAQEMVEKHALFPVSFGYGRETAQEYAP